MNDKFRSPELLALAGDDDVHCTIRLPCCIDGPCVAAHSNQSKHGKGKSTKAEDCFIAFSCTPCHVEIDQGKNTSRDEKIAAWDRGFIETIKIILRKVMGVAKSKAPRAKAERSTRTKTADAPGAAIQRYVPRPYV